MIIPCIDLQHGKVVQLVQGRHKALEGAPPLEMLELFKDFPEIQVIDLDAAMGTGHNNAIVETLVARAKCRVGGGVRTPERARELAGMGALKVIVGTAAFNGPVLEAISGAVTPERLMVAIDSKHGRIAVSGWTETLDKTASEVLAELEPFCSGYLATYVDKEGMMQGTDIEWFRLLRAATAKPITAAGGITTYEEIRTLTELGMDCALGMAVYTGRLNLTQLADLNRQMP